MENTLWDKLESHAANISTMFDSHLERFENEKHTQSFDGWSDTFWKSKNIRKCHLKIINDGKMWLLHINIFPEDGVNLPILGFDMIASKSKISGSFFDFSPIIKDSVHPLSEIYKMAVKDIAWNKPRDLPEWATNIFSDNMIAAGSIKEGDELDQLISISSKLINTYLFYSNAEWGTAHSTKKQLNTYCKNQKLNKHLHRSILAMGIPLESKDYYVNNVLFEEI